jgi:hypothetical protein
MNNDRQETNAEIPLDAILYALNDPALDRLAFEQRLENEPELCEQIANAVGLIEEIRGVERSTWSTAANRLPARDSNRNMPSGYVFIAALAASIVVLLGLSWLGRSWETSHANSASSMVLAWTDLQSEISDSFDPMSDLLRDVMDSDVETDLPEWLIMATSVEGAGTSEIIQ